MIKKIFSKKTRNDVVVLPKSNLSDYSHIEIENDNQENLDVIDDNQNDNQEHLYETNNDLVSKHQNNFINEKYNNDNQNHLNYNPVQLNSWIQNKDPEVSKFSDLHSNPMQSTDSETRLKQKFLNGKIYVESLDSTWNNFDTKDKFIFGKPLITHDFSPDWYHINERKRLLFKIKDLSIDGIEGHGQFFNANLNIASVDIYSGDRIAIFSDEKKYDGLFEAVLKNKIDKSSGKILRLNEELSMWQILYDIENPILDNECIGLNDLQEINYRKLFNLKKTLNVILSKIIYYFRVEITKETLLKFLKEFFLIEKSDWYLKDLSKPQRNRFFLLCDVLVGKKVTYINYIGVDLNIKDKTSFLMFLRNYYSINKDLILIVMTNDIMELKMLCNKIIVLDNQAKKDEKYFEDILKYYGSIEDYISLLYK